VPRPKIHDDALRLLLLERAGATLTAQGLDALSLRTLAEDAGTSTTAVYALFGGKPGLVRALRRGAVERFVRQLDELDTGEDPVEDLVRLALAYRLHALADRHSYELMFVADPAAGASPPATAMLQPATQLVRRARDAGLLRRNVDPLTVALSVWALTHGLVSLQLRELVPLTSEDPARTLETALRTHLVGWADPADDAVAEAG
jgi:AcrR family transcriptional regulator